ncbi:MAG: hypothetical protein K0R08_1993 [Solimicrobium sp.]|jgi:transcriptional regulator with XRE-family HTH domain|nr:hypothetical protein [Solimicrobium sp.]
MPKKNLTLNTVPTLVLERLRIWGAFIRKQRIVQRIKADDLCSRMSISDATLRRIEKGDPRVGVATYFSALYILGVLDKLAPILGDSSDFESLNARVRATDLENNNDF